MFVTLMNRSSLQFIEVDEKYKINTLSTQVVDDSAYGSRILDLMIPSPSTRTASSSAKGTKYWWVNCS
jgi:hypothetical protein